MPNSVGAVCSGSMLFASIFDSSVMLGNYLQQTTSADDIFGCIFFLGTLRIKVKVNLLLYTISVHHYCIPVSVEVEALLCLIYISQGSWQYLYK